MSDAALDVRSAKAGIARALDDLDRYEQRTYGHRDAKLLLARSIEKLVDAKIALALDTMQATASAIDQLKGSK